MPKCTGSHVSSARPTLGGPIIMASNVQQQKQCIKRRHRQTLHSFHQQQHRIHLQQQQQQQKQQQQQNHQKSRHSHQQQELQQQQQQQQRQQFQQQQERQHAEQSNALAESRYVRRGNRLHHIHKPRNLKSSANLSNLAFDILKIVQIGLVVALFQILLCLTFTNAEGNVGCHFVRTLCLDGSEVCYDDNIFGKCIPTTGVDVEDIERTPLMEQESRLLATMLEELQGAGLGWDHPYVQCRIQGALFSLQRQTQLPPNLCANLAPSPDVDPASALAYVRFTPPENEVEVQLVDNRGQQQHQPLQQLYYPPPKKQGRSSISDILHQLQLQERRPLRHDPLELEHFGKFDVQGSQVETPNVMKAFLDTERQRIEREEKLREAELQEEEQRNAQKERLELYQILAASEPDPQPYQRKPPSPIEQFEEVVVKPTPAYVPEEINESSELYFPDNYMALKRSDDKPAQRSFFRELAAEEGLEQLPISRDYFNNVQLSSPLEAHLSLTAHKRRPTDYDENEIELERQQAFEEGLVRNSLTPFEEEAMLASNTYPRHNPRKFERVYTEGGVVYVPEDEMQGDDAGVMKQSLLANMLGFARHERLDVKKPGPLLGPPAQETNHFETDKLAKADGNKEVLPAHIKGSNEAHKKKKLIKTHSDEDHAPHSVDTEYAHVYVKNPIDSWNDGVRIMNELANVLHMQGYFTYLTVQPHEVSFRVDSNNPEHKTATDVARTINENRGVKNNILRRLGVTVLHAGVGDKVKAEDDVGVSSARIELAESPDVTHIMAYMFAGAGAAAIIVICVTLILIKRHDRKRDKLGGLQSGISGAESCSKDYQDLCRARMAGKGNTAEPAAGGRITSLSKENDRPPSSRSSTSSWSEEPALTNMDISTGHMVLSYMEDHLRNKGRLQREWEALCRYEAEPSARDAAAQPQCANLNRSGAPIPYDHSRVVLNHLANADGLDYVNASTITDHDPRAPVCYVAAQGPMPATLAHFWQMIWEQGAVVIVALCRLQENGEVACARYWPEEGAEVYHIYEVHLVSEHIWCDDYLVRSFYLKNLRTSETRTVTQFHFLSWPQGGVPAQAKALLDFRRKVNKSYRGRSCPIVVHGSEGAGRTGAYILLDLVLGRMNKGAREIDIAATLEHLRDQRAGLVATRQQFEFVLMAVAEEVHAILKALPANTSGEKRELEAKEKEATQNAAQKSEKTEKDKSAEELPNTAQKTKATTATTIAGAIAEASETSEQSTKEHTKSTEKEKDIDKGKEKDQERDKDKDREQEKQAPKPKNAKGAKNKK